MIAWHEDGLGGEIQIQQGEEVPAQASLFSWLVREAQADSILAAPGHELGEDGVAVALPLRRENSALTGFLVFILARRPPAFVSDALAASLDELGLALPGQAEQPRLAPAPEAPDVSVRAAG